MHEPGLLEGDYVSPGFDVIRLDSAFPNMISGRPGEAPWPWMELGANEHTHRWYADRRIDRVGFANRDEVLTIHAIAKLMAGCRGLEIGCFMGWTASHIAAAGVMLDVVDPWLDGFVGESVRSSVVALNLQNQMNLIQDYSPNAIVKLGRHDGLRWSFAFIDGDHAAPLPLADTAVVQHYMEQNAIIVFHDVYSPDVSAGIDLLKTLGWKTRVMQTSNGLAVAWRGNVDIPRHIADPSKSWRLPAHLLKHTD